MKEESSFRELVREAIKEAIIKEKYDLKDEVILLRRENIDNATNEIIRLVESVVPDDINIASTEWENGFKACRKSILTKIKL